MCFPGILVFWHDHLDVWGFFKAAKPSFFFFSNNNLRHKYFYILIVSKVISSIFFKQVLIEKIQSESLKAKILSVVQGFNMSNDVRGII